MSMPTPPPVSGGFTADDLALWRDATRRARRWFSVATGKSATHPRTVALTSTGASGTAVQIVDFNLRRLVTQIYVPPGALQIYWAFDSTFGNIDTTNNLAQFGQYIAANSYLKFEQEYPGEVWMLNAGPANESINIRVVELFSDDSVWK